MFGITQRSGLWAYLDTFVPLHCNQHRLYKDFVHLFLDSLYESILLQFINCVVHCLLLDSFPLCSVIWASFAKLFSLMFFCFSDPNKEFWNSFAIQIVYVLTMLLRTQCFCLMFLVRSSKFNCASQSLPISDLVPFLILTMRAI